MSFSATNGYPSTRQMYKALYNAVVQMPWNTLQIRKAEVAEWQTR